ncbi:MAG: DUF1638 domain-containing protein [Chloroflexi bacterium]|nr:DUF1638 domain-containing protein [Chloroflexota bacterium]
MTHYVALTCSALARTIYAGAATSSATISVQLMDQGLHVAPGNLRKKLQAQIDLIEPDSCDAVLMVYGICGMSTLGLKARHAPLVIPRVHDCVALYLGSHKRYLEEFNAQPGTYWYSADYLERKGKDGGGIGASFSGNSEELRQEYVEKYGEDNAEYLMEVMGEWGKHYTRAAFIETGTIGGGKFEETARDEADRRGWNFERLLGDSRLLDMLLRGEWGEDEFLVVQPGEEIGESFDEGLILAKPTELTELAEQPIAPRD